MILSIIILVYLLISFGAYKKYISKWNNNKFEKIYFSLIWPLVLILYGIRKIQDISK